MSKTLRIEINFPTGVEVSDVRFKALVFIVDDICKDYEANHPHRTMWPAGIDSKITYMPMTREDEKARGLEFDDDTLAIDVAERENYEYPCARCGKPQGDHKGLILNPPAGDCEFEARNG